MCASPVSKSEPHQPLTLFDLIRDLIPLQVDKSEQENFKKFAEVYLHHAPAAELDDATSEQLLAQVIDAFNGFRRGPGKKGRIRISNPHYSAHTVAQVHLRDQPFLVDSVWVELNRHGYEIHHTFHPVLYTKRDKNGHLEDFTHEAREGYTPEALIQVEFDRQDAATMKAVQAALEDVIIEARTVVSDFDRMTAQVGKTIGILHLAKGASVDENFDESIAFLEWLLDNNFIFLGYRQYHVTYHGTEEPKFSVMKGSGLGILRDTKQSSVAAPTVLSDLPPNMRRYLQSSETLTITKALTKSRIHRNAEMDYIGVKEFDKQGRVTVEHRFLGLYTSRAYTVSARAIPIVRRKIDYVLGNENNSGQGGHNHRTLVNILETYPRDELFQISNEDLYRIATGITHLKERQQTRLFVRRSVDERLVSAMVFMPRDRFTRLIRQRITRILSTAYHAEDVEYNISLGDSLLARSFYKIRVKPDAPVAVDDAQVERDLIAATRSWEDGLRRRLVSIYGESQGLKLLHKYASAFRAGYQDATTAEDAAADIAQIEKVVAGDDFRITLTNNRLKIFLVDGPLQLSAILPLLEKLGLHVLSEQTSQVYLGDLKSPVWVHDFAVTTPTEELGDEAVQTFTLALKLVWLGEMESDLLNSLILTAGLPLEAITVLRAYVAYLQQVGTKYSQEYIRNTLVKHSTLTALLWQLFSVRFSHHQRNGWEARQKQILATLLDELKNVSVLDEDIIIRQLTDTIMATVRSNAFKREKAVSPVAFKLESRKVPGLPKPRPLFEIFVHHATVEGIHLRGGKVARGGIRWSDRPADFRTEVLGLMKTQMTKNAVIVPVGSKGGFILKRAPEDREALMATVKECYTTFIGSLLELTDNIVGGKITTPKNIRRHDAQDPYLVVAADKGTATFSDMANAISNSYGFWLGDAFASGGSHGYDHKKIAITARGGWECVKRHFRELGKDIQKEDFTVIGIGDMAGDVFGNGVLLSKHIRLQAAFNHLHIFLDPEPDAASSFKERKRMFDLPRSSWEDYDTATLSKGGGVWSRKLKEIPLSVAAQKMLKLKKDKASPNEVIQAILKMDADLLWNGGIGTFVKASGEDQLSVGDRANDEIRINAAQLGVKVVGEGGNLGFTQLARIEFASKGGRINTDAIDNSAGVDCSDHEVNIKILLQQPVQSGKLSFDNRNKLLAEMTDDVSAQVLRDNYLQSQAISYEVTLRAVSMIEAHQRTLEKLEKKGLLDRAVEFLPTAQEFEDRERAGKGLTRPEISVLMAYGKMDLYQRLLDSPLPDDKTMTPLLHGYFPQLLQDKFKNHIAEHPLRREIIATVLSNLVFNRMGLSFLFRMCDETGADDATVVRACVLAMRLYGLEDEWQRIEKLDGKIPALTQLNMLDTLRQLTEHVTFWLLRRYDPEVDLETAFNRYQPVVHEIIRLLPDSMTATLNKRFQKRVADWQARGLDEKTAGHIALAPMLNAAQDIAQTAIITGKPVGTIMQLHFHVGEKLSIGTLYIKAQETPQQTYWHRLATQTILDSIYNTHRNITAKVLEGADAKVEAKDVINSWFEKRRMATGRYNDLVVELRDQRHVDHAMLDVVLDHLKNIAM